MAAPGITVTVTGALAPAGIPTDTGVLFFLYTGATGPTAAPVRVTSMAQATGLASPVPTAIAAWLGDFFAQGGAVAHVLKVTAVDAAAPTAPELAAAFALLTDDLGPGQVVVAGLSTSLVHAALLTHDYEHPTRVALLDVADAGGFSASGIATAAAALASANGSKQAGMFGPWILFPGLSGTGTRTTPGSVIAAALAARSDAQIGSAGANPSSATGGRAISIIDGALGLSTTSGQVSAAEADTLYAANVNPFRMNADASKVWLQGWVSLSSSSLWHQLQHGRLAAEVGAKVGALMAMYSGENIDGQGKLFARVAGDLRGYFLGLYNENVLYGDKPGDAFDVVVDSTNNTDTTIAAGELHGAVAFTPANSVEQIAINAVVRSI